MIKDTLKIEIYIQQCKQKQGHELFLLKNFNEDSNQLLLQDTQCNCSFITGICQHLLFNSTIISHSLFPKAVKNSSLYLSYHSHIFARQVRSILSHQLHAVIDFKLECSGKWCNTSYCPMTIIVSIKLQILFLSSDSYHTVMTE